jgi:hypothetical protein
LEVKVIRERPVKPPITQFIITMSPVEAMELQRFLESCTIPYGGVAYRLMANLQAPKDTQHD